MAKLPKTKKAPAEAPTTYDDTLVGYARVSTAEQSLQMQIDALIRAGVALLAAFAQFERDQIQERTKAGVKRAREAGKQFGQPPKVTEKNRVSIERAIHKGLTVKEVAKAHRISESCLRLWYSRADLNDIRDKGPRSFMPTRKPQRP